MFKVIGNSREMILYKGEKTVAIGKLIHSRECGDNDWDLYNMITNKWLERSINGDIYDEYTFVLVAKYMFREFTREFEIEYVS